MKVLAEALGWSLALGRGGLSGLSNDEIQPETRSQELVELSTMSYGSTDFIQRDKDGNHIYKIPDSNGGWMRSSPDAHNDYVYEVDKRLDGKVKPLVSLLKAWKYYYDVPIRSFYLEMRVAKYAYRQEFIVYSWDLTNIFKSLWDNQLAALKDPKGIVGSISPCASEARRSDALSKLKTAMGRAEKARADESAGNTSDAFYWWNLLFAGEFPACG